MIFLLPLLIIKFKHHKKTNNMRNTLSDYIDKFSILKSTGWGDEFTPELLVLALYKKGAINKESYNGKLRSIKLGHYSPRVEANRNSKIVGWHFCTKVELLAMEVLETKSFEDFYPTVDELTQMYMQLGYKKSDAEYQASSTINGYLYSVCDYDEYYGMEYTDLVKAYNVYTKYNVKGIYLPSEGSFYDGYCCKDCDGCKGQYAMSRYRSLIWDWRKALEK